MKVDGEIKFFHLRTPIIVLEVDQVDFFSKGEMLF